MSKEHESVCPKCGHCPTCGRSNQTQIVWNPPWYQPVPVNPYPVTITYTSTTSGNYAGSAVN